MGENIPQVDKQTQEEAFSHGQMQDTFEKKARKRIYVLAGLLVLMSLIVLVILGITNSSTTVSSNIKRVSISSSVTGWGYESEDLTIICSGKQCHYRKDNGEISVPSSLIDNLVLAMNEPTIRKIDIARLGITQEWLNFNVDNFIRSRPEWYIANLSDNKESYIRKTFTNIKLVGDAIETYYGDLWTDDHPELVIEIETDDGIIKIYSEVQQKFMIPLTISNGATSVTSYNHKISEAIADLMPDNFPNKSRLKSNPLQGGVGVDDGLVFALMEEFIFHGNEWKSLELEEKTSAHALLLKNKFEILHESLGMFSGYDSGLEGKTEAWLTHLKLKGENRIFFELALPVINGTITNAQINNFLIKADEYVNTVKSISWIQDYLSKNPNVKVEIQYDKESSVNTNARVTLKRYAEWCDTQDFEDKVSQYLNTAIHVQFFTEDFNASNNSAWLILPNKEMALLSHNWPGPNMLNYLAVNSTNEVILCDISYWGTGIIVSPSGNVVSSYQTNSAPQKANWIKINKDFYKTKPSI